jgi:hypothetical protein
MSKKLTIKVTGIKWDDSPEGIPTEWKVEISKTRYKELTEGLEKEDILYELSEYVSDYISDETGYCHTGFSMDIDNEEILEEKISKLEEKEEKQSKKVKMTK